MPISLTERLERCYTGAVHDVMREMGIEDCALPPTLRPLIPDRTLAGQVSTLSGYVDQGADQRDPLFEWTGVLSKVPSGNVLVCQPNDSVVAHMGELSAETLHLRGIRGYIVDGGCRDVDFLLKIGFQVYCRYFTPRDIVGHWMPNAFGEPIEIGGVTIHTGDYIIAAFDGIVVLPGSKAEEIVKKSEEIMGTESLLRKAIRQGDDPQVAYQKYGRF